MVEDSIIDLENITYHLDRPMNPHSPYPFLDLQHEHKKIFLTRLMLTSPCSCYLSFQKLLYRLTLISISFCHYLVLDYRFKTNKQTTTHPKQQLFCVCLFQQTMTKCISFPTALRKAKVLPFSLLFFLILMKETLTLNHFLMNAFPAYKHSWLFLCILNIYVSRLDF